MITRTVPKRSAIAPENGCAAPQIRVCIATESAKISRSQPWAAEIGVRKKPSAERGPKPIIEIRQPQTTTTIGVRQDSAGGTAADSGRTTSGFSCCTGGAFWTSGRRDRGPLDRLLDDRQVDHRGQDAEQDREPPDRIVGAGLH